MTGTESWIERAARLHPERMAVDSLGGAVTNAELDRASWSVADLLAAEHAPGARIALPLTAGVAFAAALHGCLRAGAVAVPIDGRLPDEQREARIAACDGILDRGALDDVIERSTHDPPAARVRLLAGTGADRDTPAVLLYTSGSTGPGTPILLSRGALLWNAIGSAAALGQPPHERWLSAMPVAHVGGLTVFARSAIGATTAVVRPRFDVDEQVALLMAGEGTITSVVPTMLGRMLDAGLDHPPNLRLVLLGGAPITPELLARADAAGVPVAGTYGMTEACSQVFTAGAPLFCTEVARRGELTRADEPGTEDPARAEEILVRGPTLALGVADAHGWLATGDRGARAPDGTLRVIGRLAETIITGGENVAPTEVEAHLLAQPGITDAAVLGVPDPDWGERIEARVVLSPGAELDEPALRDALRAVLPPFAVPKAISVVDGLPRTPTGKLRRIDLR
ncbi:MAG: AMP-binding protein [Solirubrobacteraceae bacterium]|nr:AMP-binding protein [Solirubrobacteraceae bacterium]